MSEAHEYKGKGLTGLANLGNTCFINSCIQLLSHTYELNDFLSSGEYKKKLNKKVDSVLLIEWDKLRQMMWSENCTISPGGFVQAVQKVAKIKNKDLFTGWAQNDLPEFLLFLTDCFHNAMMREVDMNIVGTVKTRKDRLAKSCYEMMSNMYKKEYSEFLNIFYGIHVSKISSVKTNKELSFCPEPFFMIDVPIPNIKMPTLFDCFDIHCQNETLEGENAWYNDKTKEKEDVNKRIIFWSLPNIMVIDIKRFNEMGRKNQVPIQIPQKDVNFSRYVEGYDKDSYIYDLYGVCNHMGGVLGGHYTASVKNANDKWYTFNDTNVTEFNMPDDFTSNYAYCLFYRKKKK